MQIYEIIPEFLAEGHHFYKIKIGKNKRIQACNRLYTPVFAPIFAPQTKQRSIMDYQITRYNEGYPFLARIIADAVADNYAMGLLATVDACAMTVIGADEDLTREYLRLSIRLTEDEDFIQTLSLTDLDEDTQIKDFLNSPLGKGFTVDKVFPNMLNLELPVGQFTDGVFVETLLRQVFGLKDDSEIYAITNME